MGKKYIKAKRQTDKKSIIKQVPSLCSKLKRWYGKSKFRYILTPIGWVIGSFFRSILADFWAALTPTVNGITQFICLHIPALAAIL